MPMYFARWPDGSFSVVHAHDEQDAYVQLDELGVEPATIRWMRSLKTAIRYWTPRSGPTCLTNTM